MNTFFKTLFCVAAACVLCALTGCATTESENASVRPWNSPKSWEHGLPSAMTEGR
jgi:hypothetical protein